jgi:hypothetical protein
MMMRQSAFACDFSEISLEGWSVSSTAVEDFGFFSGAGRALPGTKSLWDDEKVRSGVNVMPAIRDGDDKGNIRCCERSSGLMVEPEAARQERPRHGVLTLIPLKGYYTVEFDD